jgi:hypothetical protein
MRFAAVVFMVLIASLSVPCRADAQNERGASQSALEPELSKYDPRAVAAARHYFDSPAIKAGIIAIVSNIDSAVSDQLLKENPKFSPTKADQVKKVVDDSSADLVDLLMPMHIIAALDIYTPDELVALDDFYSSPLGASVLKKTPQLAAQAPAIIQAVMPRYLTSLQARLKAAGLEPTP